MRHAAKWAIVLALLLGGCGGESSLSIASYVEQMQESTDELQALGVQVNAELANHVDLETGRIVDSDAVGTVMADIASALRVYHDDLKDLNAPSEIEEAHDTFLAAAGARLEQWETAADQATELESVEDLDVATRKSPSFQAACVALERAVDESGLQLDLDCGDV
ncbi:MAG: hypothetical protein OEU32_05240 [Acidimicrobiia bacterium]|nr:hypothetical protein [Acidimicrobiia bacterium]